VIEWEQERFNIKSTWFTFRKRSWHSIVTAGSISQVFPAVTNDFLFHSLALSLGPCVRDEDRKVTHGPIRWIDLESTLFHSQPHGLFSNPNPNSSFQSQDWRRFHGKESLPLTVLPSGSLTHDSTFWLASPTGLESELLPARSRDRV
jgi:hypothetical protein